MKTATWPWERLSASNASSHDLLVELLDPQPGETFLDIGTGGGGVATRAAARGADAVGVDISPEAIEVARASESGARFEVADAQALPFEDGSFDVVASAYGVNFAPDHARAAGELARVCRVGGRLGLAVMPMDSRAAALWTLVRTRRVEGDHPGSWRPELLEEWFELEVRERESEPTERYTPEEAWQFARTNMSFVRDVVDDLEGEDLAEFERAFLELAREYENRPLRSTLILGTRR